MGHQDRRVSFPGGWDPARIQRPCAGRRPDRVSTKRMRIELAANGEGRMICDGLGTFECLGRCGLTYPEDLTISVKDKSKHETSATCYASWKWATPDSADVVKLPENEVVNAPMRHAILLWAQRGVYIHEWTGPATYAANGGPSGGGDPPELRRCPQGV